MSRPLPGGVPADFEIRLRARTEAGRSESYGLAFRRDRGDEYLARVDTRNNNVRLYRHDNGTATLLAARDLGVTVGRSHELAVRAVGATLAVALDGEPLLRATDHGRADGAIALWAETPTRVCFEGLWLAPVDTTP